MDSTQLPNLVLITLKMFENRTASEKKNKCWNKKNQAIIDALEAEIERKEAMDAQKIKPIITKK